MNAPRALSVAALVLAAACSKNVSDEAPTQGQKSVPASSQMPSSNAQKPLPSPTPVPGVPSAMTPPGAPSFEWTKPSSWQDAPNPSTFRLATYKLGADTEVSVSQAGGSIDQNVQRWAGQFGAKPEDAKRTERTVAGKKAVVVELTGTFTPMAMPGKPASGPKSDQQMLAAIIGDSEPYLFFRMTGPKAEVEGARADFDKLLDSVKAK